MAEIKKGTEHSGIENVGQAFTKAEFQANRINPNTDNPFSEIAQLLKSTPVATLAPAGKSKNRVWTTTDIEHHDPGKFMYTVKMNRPARLLYPEQFSDIPERYSASLVSQDNLATFMNWNIGLVLEFPDDYIEAVLRYQHQGIDFTRLNEKLKKGFK